jgi:hypothetical protein
LLVLLFVLFVVSAGFRIYDVGALSFFGDEETTAFAARSLALGEGSSMPSGMPYRRALPYTWLNAVSARLVGLDSELAYRLPVAFLGALTIPLLFAGVAAIAGNGTGLVAALLLATSGWHLVWSRTARMYVPALLVSLAFFFVAWNWQRYSRPRDLGSIILLYVLAVFLHSASAAIVLFPILFALLYEGKRVSVPLATVVSGGMAAAGWALDRLFVVAPYARWASGFSALDSAPTGQLAGALAETASRFSSVAWLVLPAGALLGWTWSREAGVLATDRSLARRAVIVLSASTAGAGALAGLPLVAGSIGLCTLLLDARGTRPWWHPGWVGVALVGSALAVFARLQFEGAQLGQIARMPFPYLPYLGKLMPVLVAIFVLQALRLAVVPARQAKDDLPIRAAVVYVVGYSLALGFAVAYAPWRYLLPIYPWVVLVVAVAIRDLVNAMVDRRDGDRLRRAAWAGAVAVVMSGAIGGHGIPATFTVLRADHGSIVPWNDPGLQVRPDHRGPGRFVLQQRNPGDVVIAEDVLEQRWYAGRVDFWYRSLNDARRYLYQDDDGRSRDIYVGAELLDHPPEEDLLVPSGFGTWLITSGETASSRSWYLDPVQASWLDSLQAATRPVFVGEDGLTEVYCFGRCP